MFQNFENSKNSKKTKLESTIYQPKKFSERIGASTEAVRNFHGIENSRQREITAAEILSVKSIPSEIREIDCTIPRVESIAKFVERRLSSWKMKSKLSLREVELVRPRIFLKLEANEKNARMK